MGYPRKLSIRTSRQIGTVLDKGRRFAAGPLKLYLLDTGESGPNLTAFSVPRCGRTIVERNRLKRRIQEFARSKPVSGNGRLIVLRAYAGCYDLDFGSLKKLYGGIVENVGQNLHSTGQS